MKKCSFCGTDNQDNAVFCELCGRRFEAEPEEKDDKIIIVNEEESESDTAIVNEVVETETAQETKQTNYPVNTVNTDRYYSEPVQSNSQQDVFADYKRRTNNNLLFIILFAIVAVIAVIFIATTSGGKDDDGGFVGSKNEIDILADNITIAIGQTAELRISSSVSKLNANYNDCIDTYWNNDKTSGDTYYLEVTGMEVGTCYLKVQDYNNSDLYDTVVINVVASEDEVSTGDNQGSSVVVKQTLDIPAPTDNPITIDGIFVGETLTISEESIVTYNGTLSTDGAKDVYSFTAPRDGRYGFEVKNISANDGVRVIVFNAADENIMDVWGGSGYANMNGGETYEIQVRQDDGFPTYTLDVYVQKPTADLSNVTTVYDQIAFEDQKNVYTFTAPVTGRYHFELSEYKNGVGFRMMMWDKLDNNIMDSWSESATVTLDAGETYDFQIRQDEGFHAYKLSIGSQKEPADITGYDIITDSVTFEDQKNIYLFTPETSGKYTFTLSNYDGTSSFRLMAWDNYENNIMDTYSESGSVNLESGITYQIQVRQDEGYSSYKLLVDKEQ